MGMDHYTINERREWAKKRARQQAALDETLRVGVTLARSAASEGVPETVLAEQLGVNRQTIRKWVGKR